MGKYQIQDPTTGKIVTVEGNTAPSQADAEQIFHQAGLRTQTAQQGALQGPWNALMDKPIPGIGSVGQIPALGGIIRGAGDEAAQLGQQGLQAGATPTEFSGMGGAAPILNQIFGKVGTQPNRFMSSDQYSAATDPNVIKRSAAAIGPVANTILNMSIAKGIPALAKGIIETPSAIKGVLSMGTKQGAVAAQKAGVARGADFLISEVEKQALAKTGKFEEPVFLKTVKATIERMSPKGRITTTKGITTEDALKFRQTLDKEIPRSAWKDPGAQTAEVRAKMTVRQTIDNMLKESAPGVVKPDKALSAYAKMGGDIPSLLKKLGIILAVDRASSMVGGPTAETGADIFTILKVLGKL